MQRGVIVIGLFLAWPGLLRGQSSSIVSIEQHALTTLKVPGFADFLVADGEAVWATNRGRIDKLQRDRANPVSSVSVPNPCGAMEKGFGAIWVANCEDRSLYRIDRQTARVAAILGSLEAVALVRFNASTRS